MNRSSGHVGAMREHAVSMAVSMAVSITGGDEEESEAASDADSESPFRSLRVESSRDIR
jgi:hypothetical protein